MGGSYKGPRIGEKGTLRDDSSDEKREVKGIFVLYKRVLCTPGSLCYVYLQDKVYKRIRLNGDGICAVRVCYPC